MKVLLFRVLWGWYLVVFVCIFGIGDEFVIGDDVNGFFELFVDMNEFNLNEFVKLKFVFDFVFCGIFLFVSGIKWFVV